MEDLQRAAAPTGGSTVPSKGLRSLLDEYERRLILLALDAAGGHQRRAAASLGVLPSTLSEKMKRLGLRPMRVWGVPGAADGERASARIA